MCLATRAGENMDVTNRMTCEEAIRQFFAYLDRALAGEALRKARSKVD